MISLTSRLRLKLALFPLLSLAAILLGAVTMADHGIATSRWAINLAGWAAGGLIALGIARAAATPAKLRAITLVAATAICATLAGPAQSEVHRWLALGPLTVNMAALCLPAGIAALARLPQGEKLAYCAMLVIAVTLVVQPDASQALGFALALLAIGKLNAWRGAGMIWPLAGIALLAVLRPDRLRPVPEVEQIVSLALITSPVLAVAMVAALAGTVASLALSGHQRNAALPLAAYTLAVCAAPLAGWFPVPLAGSGVSFALGLWLGWGVLSMRPPHGQDVNA
jgi:hypothetical protein